MLQKKEDCNCGNDKAPGTVLSADRNGILVQTGCGSLLLTEVQPEGKKRMSAADYLLGHPVPAGTLLE